MSRLRTHSLLQVLIGVMVFRYRLMNKNLLFKVIKLLHIGNWRMVLSILVLESQLLIQKFLFLIGWKPKDVNEKFSPLKGKSGYKCPLSGWWEKKYKDFVEKQWIIEGDDLPFHKDDFDMNYPGQEIVCTWECTRKN
jgi:hypothetical protein